MITCTTILYLGTYSIFTPQSNFSLHTFFNLPMYVKFGSQNSTHGLPHSAQHVALWQCMNLHPTPVYNLTFVYPCIASIIVNDDQQDAITLAYLFIPNRLCMFRAKTSPKTCRA